MTLVYLRPGPGWLEPLYIYIYLIHSQILSPFRFLSHLCQKGEVNKHTVIVGRQSQVLTNLHSQTRLTKVVHHCTPMNDTHV